MKTNYRAAYAMLFIPALTIVGCSNMSPIPDAARGTLDKSTLGQLPTAPSSVKDSDIVSLVQANGEMPKYKVKVKSSINDGDKWKCEVKAGEIVEAIADAGDYLLIHAQRTSLASTCENSGEASFVEGYMTKSNLELIEQAPMIESNEPPLQSQADATAVNQGGSSPSKPAETIEDTVSQGTTTTSSTPLECESVKYGTTKTANSAKKSSSSNRQPNPYAQATILWASYSSSANKMPGALWREGGDYYVLKIAGKAAKWKIQANNVTKKKSVKDMPAKTISASKVAVKGKENEFRVVFQEFVQDPNSWFAADIEVIVTPLSESGEEGKKTCKLKLSLVSPLVLDFSGQKMISTLSFSKSSAEFDLDADGTAEQSGWVSGRKSAFLVLDKNHNGKIDNGRELFGDATLLSDLKTQAKDGYAALAQYDHNNDGLIDKRDPVFNALALWFDRNGNGKTDAGELETLKQRQVSSISLAHTNVPRATALQHTESGIPNDVRLQSSFSAAGCPRQGCKMYDIYFGSITTKSVSQK